MRCYMFHQFPPCWIISVDHTFGWHALAQSINSCVDIIVPWSQRFFLIFLRERDQEQAAKAATTTRERDEEGEKNLWLPWPRISLSCRRQLSNVFVKRVKLLIKRVTNGNSANTCLPAAIFLSGVRPGEIMLWTNHLHLGGKEWFVNRGQAKACVNDGRQESRNKNTTL